MASYKVAQDVEADDKLLGPFSFRQFIYLVVAVMGGILAYGLAQLFVGLALIPAPIILFFLVLALPLRKDQPMEIYLAAIVSFYLKPRKRLWEPDGVQSLIEVVASEQDERKLTKDVYGSEAEQRLAYLANLADTQGWSIRNVAPPSVVNSSMNADAYYDAQNTSDTFDEYGDVAQNFDTMIDKADVARRQSLINQMHNPQAATQTMPTQSTVTPGQTMTPAQSVAPTAQQSPPPIQPGTVPASQSFDNSSESTPVSFNPYPVSMQQHVINPAGTTPPTPPQAPAPALPTAQPEPDNTTSEKPLSPAIINLANNNDLSVETIAREAQRIEAKEKNDEVIISLR